MLPENSSRPHGHAGPLGSGPFARHLVAVLDAAVYVVDPTDGAILDANRAASEMTGFPVDRLCAMQVADLNLDLAAPGAWDRLSERVRREGRVVVTGEHRTEEGSTVPVEISIHRVEDQGTTLHLAVVQDLSDRLAAEAAREAIARDVEARVKELGLLHSLASLFHTNEDPLERLIGSVLDRIPPAWQYPEITEAQITYGDLALSTPGFQGRIASQLAKLTTLDGTEGQIEVAYTEERPPADHGPFLEEERSLLESVVAMLQNHLDDRLRAEEAETNRERFELAARASADILWEWQAEDDSLWWSPDYEEVMGEPPEAVASIDTWAEHVHPEDREKVVQGVRAFLASEEELYEQRYRLRRHDGTYAHVLDRGVAVRDEQGAAVRVVGASLDRTAERKAARETALQARMLDEIGQAVIATDPEGTVEFWNPAAQALYGYTAEEALGADIADLTVPETTRQQGREIMDALQRGEAWTGEFTVRDRSGREFPAMVTDAPIHDEEGELIGIIGISQDLTEKRQAEALREEAIRHQAEAEHFEEVASFKTQFLNTAAHELSTPITPVRFQLEGLRSEMFGELTDQQAEALAVIERNVLRFERLTRDLLDAARLQAGQLKLDRERVDVGLLVEETTRGFGGPASQAGVDLRLEVKPGLTIQGDEDRLGQVVTNLVDNALKFTPAGGCVTVQAEAEGDGARITVEDDGVGMDETQLSRLFEPFTQLHDPGTTERRGTGLGLYVTRGIVEQHGGTLEVKSPGRGAGTVFTVHLPYGGLGVSHEGDR